MLIECQNCHTRFTLNEALVPPEGAWLRCSRCEEVFFAEKPGQRADLPFPPPLDSPRPDAAGLSAGMNFSAVDFGLGDDEPPKAKKRGGFFRFILWLIIAIVALLVLTLGSLVVIDRLGIKPEWVNIVRSLHMPYMEHILQSPGKQSGSLSLNNVRAYYRDNTQAGRLFVIQGEVVNLSGQTQINILVQGRLNDIHNNPARQAVIYAGPIFTPEDLRGLSLTQIQSTLSHPQDVDGKPYMLPPQGSLPFMIVLANLPDNISDYTVDIVGWEVVN